MINKIDNGTGVMDFEDFLTVSSVTINLVLVLQVMGEKNKESDIEIHFKDTFRAFS
jgi:Ca2+-binding EF-hand superfamily protein